MLCAAGMLARRRQRLAHGRACRAVEVVEDLCVLEELAPLDHPPKLVRCDEMVIATLDLVGARRARRVGDGKAQLRLAFHQGLHETGLAGTRGRRDDVQTAGFRGRLRNRARIRLHPPLLEVPHRRAPSALITLIYHDI